MKQTLAAWLRTAMMEQELTLTTLAAKSGVSYSTLDKWLRFDRTPRGLMLKQIERTLKEKYDDR